MDRQPSAANDPTPNVVSYFCCRCWMLLRSGDEIASHKASHSHDTFWISTSNEHELTCLKCSEIVQSRSECDNHMNQNVEEHRYFILNKASRPKNIREQTPLVRGKRETKGETPEPSLKGPREMVATPSNVQFEDDDYDYGSERSDSSSEDNDDPKDEDYVPSDEDCFSTPLKIPRKKTRVCMPSGGDDPKDEDYVPSNEDIFSSPFKVSRNETGVCMPCGVGGDELLHDKDDELLHDKDYTDDSAYEDEESTSPIPALAQLRTLKNLKLNAVERREMRENCVVVEGRGPAVALVRIKNERMKYDATGRFRMRSRGINNKDAFVFDTRLGQLCLKKLDFYEVSDDKGARIYKVMGALQDLLEDERIAALRENSLHYMYPSLREPRLKDERVQARVSEAICDISAKVLVTRESFKLRPAPKGFIAGAVQLFDSDGLLADCNLGGASGILIPSEADLITRIVPTGDVVAVVVVEKDTVFHNLVGNLFHKKYKCILVTGRGQPDVATRILLRKLKDSLPDALFFGLVDCNPSGIGIMSTYCFGSESRAYDNLFLNVSDIQYIGLHIEDVAPEDRQPLSDGDKVKIDNMLKYDYLTMTNSGRKLRESLISMKNENSKSDIDVLIRKKELVNYVGKNLPKDSQADELNEKMSGLRM